MDDLTQQTITEIAKRHSIPESLVAMVILNKEFGSDLIENTYEDKRFNAYTHWCNENNKEYNESERDKFYKQYDAEQKLKEDF